MRCGKLASVVDHIKPHRGNQDLFWDKSNHAALCRHCHNSYKQKLEKSGRNVVEYAETVTMDDGEVLTRAWHIKHPSDEPNVLFYKEDKYLLPIRPGDLDETQEQDETLSEGVKH